MSATPVLHLGPENGGHEAPAALPRFKPAPHNLSFTRFAHGEMKVSIYPAPVPHHLTPHACMESAWHVAAKLPQAVAEQRRLAKKLGADLLVQRSEFQDDCREISGYGGLPRKKIFRRYGRLVIKECGEIAWRKFGQSGIFLTGTVPGTGAVIAETVARYSGWLLNRVKQWFRDSFSQEYAVFAVWELQQRGMLHTHFCVCSMEKAVLSQFLKNWKKLWNGLLLELSEKTRVDLFRKNKYWSWQENLDATRQDAQWLKANPARYLAKYLSKGNREECSKSVFHPSRWWSVDRKTAAEARAERIRLLLGGLPLGRLADCVNDWFASFGERFDEVIESVFQFVNPQFKNCGGAVLYAEPEVSADLAVWFEMWAAEYCAGSQEV